jgi:hypothetical protein
VKLEVLVGLDSPRLIQLSSDLMISNQLLNKNIEQLIQYHFLSMT